MSMIPWPKFTKALDEFIRDVETSDLTDGEKQSVLIMAGGKIAAAGLVMDSEYDE